MCVLEAILICQWFKKREYMETLAFIQYKKALEFIGVYLQALLHLAVFLWCMKVGLAEKTAVLFTKDGDQHNNLHDMQCMWYVLFPLCYPSLMFTFYLTTWYISLKVWACFWGELLPSRWSWPGPKKFLGSWKALRWYDWRSIWLPFVLLAENDT